MDKDSVPGLIVVIAGLVVLLTAFLVAAFHYKMAGEVATALAAITGTIGTIVGAFFGVHVGATGGKMAAGIAEGARADAEAGRSQAQDLAVRMAAAADPDRALGQIRPQMPSTAAQPSPGGETP